MEKHNLERLETATQVWASAFQIRCQVLATTVHS